MRDWLVGLTLATLVECPATFDASPWARRSACFTGATLILVDRGPGEVDADFGIREQWRPLLLQLREELARRHVPVHLGKPGIFTILGPHGRPIATARLRPDSRGLLLLRPDALPRRFLAPVPAAEILSALNETSQDH